MAAHRLRMTVPGFDIGGSNVVFVVQSNRRTPSGDHAVPVTPSPRVQQASRGP